MLGSDERRAAERILAEAWGEAVAVRAAEVVAGRRHVVRLSADDGRTAILKRSRATDSGGRWGDEPAGLASEWTALDLLGAMPEPVAARLLGGDATRRLIVIEDLPPGRLLAHSLLGSDPVTAWADLVAYAEALAAVGAWSRDRAAEHAAACRRRGLDPGGGSWWVRVIGRRREGFLAFAADLGLPTAGADAEIAEIEQILDGEIAPGFVHGDPCPDNIVLIDGRCRLLDFERSSWGSVVLDAAYLIAPFPSCWCFAGLPAEAVGPALAAYRAGLAAAGQEPAHGPGRDWDRAVAAALAGWLVARGDTIARVWSQDSDDLWGTTTMRPRLRAWLEGFLAAPGAAAFPALARLAGVLAEQAREAWPDVTVPAYPAFAGPGAGAVEPPTGWDGP
ncbi:MAG TPA: phosphotransferase [Methylomirabilota bacterium]|nr:phosphotransferase [Methylomirabilota bacterium]